jgi:hypothetical protein
MSDFEVIDDEAGITVSAVYQTKTGKRVYARTMVKQQLLDTGNNAASFVFAELRRLAEDTIKKGPPKP